MTTRSLTASSLAVATGTTTVTAADVREVMAMTTTEVSTLCRAAQGVSPDFAVDAALVDVSLLVLNGVINGVHLQFYAAGEIVREYMYRIPDRAPVASGPPPERPPMAASFPPGTRVRLTVSRDPRIPESQAAAWFQRLNWQDAPALSASANLRHEQYGAFVSGSFGVERHLYVNPKFDRPAAGGPSQMRPRGEGR